MEEQTALFRIDWLEKSYFPDFQWRKVANSLVYIEIIVLLNFFIENVSVTYSTPNFLICPYYVRFSWKVWSMWSRSRNLEIVETWVQLE